MCAVCVAQVRSRVVRCEEARNLRSLVREGDTFVWIGAFYDVFAVRDPQRTGRHSCVPWKWLRSANVYTVSYQTEPVPAQGHTQGTALPYRVHLPSVRCSYLVCAPCVAQVAGGAGGGLDVGPVGLPCWKLQGEVDELWDHSHYNLEACRATGRGPPLRYVPLGALGSGALANHSGAAARTLWFFGQLQYGSRSRCWGAVNASVHGHVRNQAGVWNDEAWARFISRASIFLNLHKAVRPQRATPSALPTLCTLSAQLTLCTRSKLCVLQVRCAPGEPPTTRMAVTFRMQKLLDSHALVISERCDARDEAEFEGMASFVDFDGIGASSSVYYRMLLAYY